ncbi:cytochrome P450 CYP82D47-like [Impatiens glandulifera]|uniref:cytochrome P450 CYP82D47-like n=1 Tax=Impatiens glandulifera TaxID=253017 RepID=UPI001FB16E19|nr:cytochrome P450 CYP82D47-like [Impatiens glandulifera]
MEFLANLSAIAAGFLALLVFLISFGLIKSRTYAPTTNNSNSRPPPELSGSWPLIGHLFRLSSRVPLFQTFGSLADEYGPVFLFRLGIQPILVVSSWEAVKDCFTINDRALSARPETISSRILGYNGAAFGFSNGPYWREIRKLAVVELLSHRRLQMLSHFSVSEVETSIKELYRQWQRRPNDVVLISEWIEKLILNLIVTVIAGKRYNFDSAQDDQEAKHFRKVVKEFMFATGDIFWTDVVPLPIFKLIEIGKLRKTKRIMRDVDSIISSWVLEHVERNRTHKEEEEEEDRRDFIDVLLSTVNDINTHGHSPHTVIKATLMNLILAGSDTTSINLIWILSLLMNNKHILKKAQEEIESKIGKERWAEESDMKNLVYLQAIVKETLRLYPPGPLSVAHLAAEDCEVAGYKVHKGMRLTVNLWKLHRDPRIWEDPDEFRPERFMGTHVELDVTGHQYEYTPFGSGRRACPGLGFAMQVTHLVMARLLQGFDFATAGDEPVDMTEGFGLTLPKVNPLQLLITPRLSSKYYI